MKTTHNSKAFSLERDRKRGESKSADEEELREIKWNVITICAIWIFTFTAYSCLQFLVVMMGNDTGDAALSLIFAGNNVTFLLGPFIIYKLGPKVTLVVAWACLILFAITNYKPKGGILIPGGFIEGLGYGLMMTVQGVYLTNQAVRYARITGLSLNTVLNVMWGVFSMALQSTVVWNKLVTSSVLDTLDMDRTTPSHPAYDCGVHVCPDDFKKVWTEPNDTNSDSVGTRLNTTTTTTIMTTTIHNASSGDDDDEVTPRERSVISISLAFAVIGLLISTKFIQRHFKQPPPLSGVEEPPAPSTKKLLLSTLHMQTMNKDMLMLIPLALYTGMHQTVILGEFAKYFVICEIGFGWYSFPLFCYGFSGAVSSLASSVLSRYASRPVQFSFAATLNLAMLAILLLWTPRSSEKFMFFFIPIVWGICEGVWFTQSSVLFSTIFIDQQEPAFASLRMLQFTGQSFAYKLVRDSCVDLTLCVYLGSLILSTVLTIVFEIRYKRKKNARTYEEL